MRMSSSNARESRLRPGKHFLLGIGLGLVGAAMVWQFYPGFWKDSPETMVKVALERREAMQTESLKLQALEASRAAAEEAAAARGRCDFEPLIPPVGASDGHARMEHPFPAGPRARAKVFTRKALTAAHAGRRRDAEVLLIAACGQYEQASSRPTVPLARVLGQLGDMYAAAAGEQAVDLRERLMARARQVLTRSAEAYASALGPNASRTLQARQRVATLEEDVIVASDAPVPEAPSKELAVHSPPVKSAKVAHSLPPANTPAARASRSEPKVDDDQPPREPLQSRGKQPSDVQLGQLASDLARLRAQAEAVSSDPAGLRQRAELARAQRDRCGDTTCLRAWYARRRSELLAEF